MTVLAWKKGAFAADSAIVDGDLTFTGLRKVEQAGGSVLFSGTGTWQTVEALKRWYMQGSDPEKYFSCFADEEDFSTFLVIEPDVVEEYRRPKPIPMRYMDRYHAWGNGRDIALGAMAAGMGVDEAVRITCRHNVYCRMPLVLFVYDKEWIRSEVL